MDRLFVSATQKSSGKTTLSVGLAAAWARQGVRVQPFKKGPDYIDPMWLTQAAGRPCLNLDMHLQTEAELQASLQRGAQGAEVLLVEGNHGLFDGLSLDGRDSNAALAKHLGAPVLLVVDARGMTRGVAPLVLGHVHFDAGVRIGGVVLNRVGGSRHEAKLRAVLEHYTGVPVLGALPEDERLAVAERHLGLMPCAEVADARQRIDAMAQLVAAQVDLDAVRALAAGAPALGLEAAAAPPPQSAAAHRVRIAIARDEAFGFYYADDLQALEDAGAELVFFDAVRDANLPRVDGLFIGGGFPEARMQALSANVAMRSQVRQAIEAGLPAYAECGGLMYLARSLSWKGISLPMAGVIPGDAVMQPRPVGRGYMRLRASAHMPWAGLQGAEVGAHEFHHSRLENLAPGVPRAWQVLRGHGVDGEGDGLVLHRLLASYAHLRGAAGTRWAAHFVAHVRAHAPCRLARA